MRRSTALGLPLQLVFLALAGIDFRLKHSATKLTQFVVQEFQKGLKKDRKCLKNVRKFPKNVHKMFKK